VFTTSVKRCSPSNASQSCVSYTGKQIAIIIQSRRLAATNDVLNIPINYPKIDSREKSCILWLYLPRRTSLSAIFALLVNWRCWFPTRAFDWVTCLGQNRPRDYGKHELTIPIERSILSGFYDENVKAVTQIWSSKSQKPCESDGWFQLTTYMKSCITIERIDLAISSFYLLGLVKWFLAFWMCELVALTRCCKIVSFYI